jgi:hypothetical protein
MDAAAFKTTVRRMHPTPPDAATIRAAAAAVKEATTRGTDSECGSRMCADCTGKQDARWNSTEAALALWGFTFIDVQSWDSSTKAYAMDSAEKYKNPRSLSGGDYGGYSVSQPKNREFCKETTYGYPARGWAPKGIGAGR